ncbi:1-(5-phosphoribosyl)-5-[(5-phosphoribosylamino)methylideneamino]imidazole-4-carboxamide isomerase [Leucothrix pacifica]|uniref:1-(5-phosphoribosyl)-5-[(5-phosphoribosylamino)methylideneamino] imidazole-4-carboxamide isomerase n=1 Tax=Leucothrix pacifica TaxID=1247513 RepID=A0A317CTY5_9GAMM|nr:1-(5-phosphoribosyl)-5-[(5-phosphoribosylamino)methylideneamino]imidazole-4-carboxamide isomerase [Leucothrix pacifica]PWQ99920.1 1-(5-phosphoribosyl)-5-((5-phosphoribosylamino)methylideneamino)imidazole-4-carboxamide isomerase [Leucothrix pacifica]
MLLIPAIDLKDGKCVRLRQGLMDDVTVFSDNPVDMATRWVDAGTKRLHLVDLNGAFEGKPVNGEVVKAIAQAYPDLPIQIGGGIRDEETVQAYLDAGVQYCIIGTKAVQDPQFVIDLCAKFPGHIIVGIDAKNGMVATDGWAEESTTSAIDLAQKFEKAGVSAIVYTDIARDGMMQGVNIDETVRLAESISIPVIASGGVTNMDDIKGLLEVESRGVSGTILGRSIYEGTIDLAEAQQYVDSVAS